MTNDMHESFTRIYETNHWNSKESRSGPTSTLHWTVNLRRELPRLLHKFDIKTLFDAPCGDMNWMRDLLKDLAVDYIGGDIVAPMIEQHKSDQELSGRASFILLDLTSDRLPSADLMLARDFLFHLSFEDTLAFLQNFARSDIPYLLTTSHINNGKFENRDIKTGNWRWIDLFQAPYNFPADVLDQILDGKNDRYLYLWTRTQIADLCDRYGYPQSSQIEIAAPRQSSNNGASHLSMKTNGNDDVSKRQSAHTEAARSLSPNEVRAIVDEANSSIASADFTSAISHAEKLVEAFPDRRQGIVLKAKALIGQKKQAEALLLLRNALELHGRDAKLLSFTRNVAYHYQGIHAAGEFALRLSEVSPADLKNEIFIIDFHLASGDAVSALRRVEALAAQFPDAEQVQIRRAQALLAVGRPNEALQSLRDALATHDGGPKLLRLAKNIAFGQGDLAQARAWAIQLSEIVRDDRKNEAFLARCDLALGDFANALELADRLTSTTPAEPEESLLKAQALVALHRVDEALETLREALTSHPDREKLLSFARVMGFQHGRFAEAIDYSLQLLKIAPGDDISRSLLVQSYMATGQFDLVEQSLESFRSTGYGRSLARAAHYFKEYTRLCETCPPVVAAWKESLANRTNRPDRESAGAQDYGATVIQYWSQGKLPDDVEIVFSEWKALVERERLGEIKLFSRSSANEWIKANAPEFSSAFSKAFHFAMESDIFRIAYASKHPCIYIDVDCWPLESTVEIIKFALQSKSSLLYFRSYRPWVANGFFVSRPDCPFFRKLADECKMIDLEALGRDHKTIEFTFGPTRYNNVLTQLVNDAENMEASSIEGVPGCSALSDGIRRILFTHEAAVASVKPPFALGYKATGDYWKHVSFADM